MLQVIVENRPKNFPIVLNMDSYSEIYDKIYEHIPEDKFKQYFTIYTNGKILSESNPIKKIGFASIYMRFNPFKKINIKN